MSTLLRFLASCADAWWLDIRLGLRMLIKYPGLTLVSGFGIAVGVAIAAGAFSIVYGNFLATLPLNEGDRIVSLEVWDSAANRPERRLLHEYASWREELKSVQELGAFTPLTLNLIASGAQPETVQAAAITASGFTVARVWPLTGRTLREEDEREGAQAVVVIGESVWRTRFAADPSVLGRTIRFGAVPHSIVGVMPESFAFPVNHRFWVPLRFRSALAQPLTGPDLMVFGRLAPGATLETAQAELDAAGRRAALAEPAVYSQLRPRVLDYANPFLGIHGTQDRTALHLINGIVATLLMLVCLNVAILVYTRTAMRHTEISVRTALGASRGRIVAQLFLEALVLSAAGAIAGVVVAALALRQLQSATLHIAADLPFWVSFRLSTGAAVYGALLSVVAAAIVGILPALQATRRGVQTGARVTGAGGPAIALGGTWTVLIVVQVGFAVALLPGALYNAWENLHAEIADPGFAAGEFLTAQLGRNNLQAGDSVRPSAGPQAEFLRRLEAEARVASATFATAVPGDEPGASIEVSGEAPVGNEAPQSHHRVRFNRVHVNFFKALHVPVLSGRGFEPSDAVAGNSGADQPPRSEAVVVNQSFAQRVFGGAAVGRRIRYTPNTTGHTVPGPGSERWYQIVGVVRDLPGGVSPGMKESQLRLYHPLAPEQAEVVNIMVRVRGGAPGGLATRLPEIAVAVHPDLHLRGIQPMVEALRREQWIRRTEAGVFAAVALSVLLLSSAGIHALMSFTVSRRRKEIGIRMALGADRTRILAGIFSRAFAQLGVGAALGAACAILLERSSNEELMGGHAPLVLAAVATFLMIAGFVAALGPARRCLAIQPTEALKEH